MILANPLFRRQTPNTTNQTLELRGSLVLTVPRLLICLCIGMVLLLFGTGATAKSATGSHGTLSTNIKSDRIKGDLKEILNEPEFQPDATEPGPITRTLESVRTQLETWWNNIRNFFRRLFGGAERNQGMVNVGLVYFLIGLIAVGAAWVIVRIISTRGRHRRKTLPKVQAITVPEAEEGETQRAPDDWIAEADRLAHASDFRAALRAVFLAILVQLDRAGKIEYQRSYTNGDYLRALRAQSMRALYELMAPLTREYELRWYGGHPANEADYQRCLDAYRRLPDVMTARMVEAPPRAEGG